MTMTRQEIYIKKDKRVLVNTFGSEDNSEVAMTLNAELMRLGFIFNENALNIIKTLSVDEIASLYNEIVPVFKELKGDGKHWEPMYPNFPLQVMGASDMELFWNAITHYWSDGEWKPDYDKESRLPAFEKVNFIKIGVGSEQEFLSIFPKLLSSNVSISETDKKIISWFLNNYDSLSIPEIPFKENLCLFVSENIELGNLDYVKDSLKTSTDILRVITHLSGGDISLSTNTRFKSMKRSLRRVFMEKLEIVISEDDVKRHQNKWNKLFHNLHVGEFLKSCPNVYKVAQKTRENVSLTGFYSQVEKVILTKDPQKIYEVLSKRPGEFARRLDFLLRTYPLVATTFIKLFEEVADKVDTRVLLQLLGHFKGRNIQENRVVFPKGNSQKARLIDKLPTIEESIRVEALESVKRTLSSLYSSKEELGKVYLDEKLKNCPIPMNLRSASESLHTVGRGTRIPLSDKNTLRLAIWWKGQDIDLSAVLFDNDLNFMENISYTNLKSSTYQSCHSGDITYALDGAAEFIDITMDGALKHGARYVVMNVFVFSGPSFSEHDECYAAWMTRDFPQQNEIFDPKTVEQKVDLTSNSKFAIPVIFDLQEKEAIWLDLVAYNNYENGGNNVESNQATIKDVIKSCLSLENKPTLYDLYELHSKSRNATFVDDKKDADTVFSMSDGITPYDILEINQWL